jgi:acyl-CoA thioester hydrolase
VTERSFRVRHYECDAYGHLNNTAYLHYLEEIEIDEGVAAGRRLRNIDIRYVAPVSFGDTVTVTVGNDGNGGRSYTFTRAATGDRVAEAVAGWTPAGRDQPEEEILPPPAEVFRRPRRIEWQDVDASTTVSPAVLAGMAEDCGLALCAAYGWPLDRCTRNGFAMVVRRHEITYARPAGLGDELVITTWASDLARASAIRHYLMTRDGVTVASFRSHYVWVHAETMRPIRIPGDFLEDFSPNFAGEAAS